MDVAFLTLTLAERVESTAFFIDRFPLTTLEPS